MKLENPPSTSARDSMPSNYIVIILWICLKQIKASVAFIWS